MVVTCLHSNPRKAFSTTDSIPKFHLASNPSPKELVKAMALPWLISGTNLGGGGLGILVDFTLSSVQP